MHTSAQPNFAQAFAKLSYGIGFIFLLCFAITSHFLYWPTPGVPRNVTSTKERASHDVDLSRPDAPFVSWPLARVCREATWTPGVVFMCDENSGGIGNIRNYILTCIRYAIHAGATGLILPQIETRSAQNLSELFAGHRPMDYFFDVGHFRTGMEQACPQMKVYDSVSHVPNLLVQRPEKITPKLFGERAGCDYRDLNRHADTFGFVFNNWLKQTTRTSNLSAVSYDHPRLIQFTWGVQWEYPVWKDGPEFANTFGGLLKFRRDILGMGENITSAVRNASVARQSIERFAGVHLRTENDALSFWPTFETQSAALIEKLTQRNFSTVYLATGNKTEAVKLTQKAHSLRENIEIFSKQQLLGDEPEQLQRLYNLTWDQQALVDFIVLLNSDFFWGVSPSSFSMTVAAKRHLGEDGIYTRPWRVGGEGDGRSYLVGNFTGYWNDWIFMYDALWP